MFSAHSGGLWFTPPSLRSQDSPRQFVVRSGAHRPDAHAAIPVRFLTVLNSRAQAGAAFDDAFGDGVARQAGDVVDAELVHNLLAMFLDGLDADAQFGRNLFVRAAFGDQLQHFGFARGQLVGAAAGRLTADERLAALIAQTFRDGRAEIGVAAMRFA